MHIFAINTPRFDDYQFALLKRPKFEMTIVRNSTWLLKYKDEVSCLSKEVKNFTKKDWNLL